MLYTKRPPLAIRHITILLVLTALGLGCGSSGPRVRDGVTVLYGKDQVQEFDAATGPEAGIVDEYVFTVGDRLDIVFLYHANLTQQGLLVRSDGRISLPYVGDQMAAGLTPMVLDSILTNRFSEILREPSLSVILTSQAKKQVFVIGQVNSPGRLSFENAISFAQAVASAGGIKHGAKPGNSMIIRREGVDRIVGVEVDLKKILSGEQIENDIQLQNEDIVYVPVSAIKNAAEFAKTFHEIVRPPLDVFLTAWQIRNLQITYEFFKLEKDQLETP